MRKVILLLQENNFYFSFILGFYEKEFQLSRDDAGLVSPYSVSLASISRRRNR